MLEGSAHAVCLQCFNLPDEVTGRPVAGVFTELPSEPVQVVGGASRGNGVGHGACSRPEGDGCVELALIRIHRGQQHGVDQPAAVIPFAHLEGADGVALRQVNLAERAEDVAELGGEVGAVEVAQPRRPVLVFAGTELLLGPPQHVAAQEDWAGIRRLHRSEGLPIKAIARVLGISKNTAKGSIVDAVEPRIRELLRVYPRMPATVIAERIGWTRSIRVLSARVAELRPVYLLPDPASRTSYAAGEIAQCDLWFPPIRLPVGFGQVRKPAQLPVLTMVTGYARWLSGVLIPTR